MSKKNYTLFIFIYLFLFIVSIGVMYQQFYPDNSVTNTDAISETTVDTTIDSNVKDESITAKKMVALTFDDGPHPLYTIKLLDGLAQRNVKVTFFIIGESSEQNPDVIKKIHSEGHLIGNHTYSHVQLTCINPDKAIEEANKTSELIYTLTGENIHYIRPPYGLYSKSLASNIHLTPIKWTIDPRDWSVLNTETVVRYVVKNVKENDVILLHDIFDTSVDAALQIIDILTEQGYTFVTIDKLITVNPKIIIQGK